ncbi:MAG: phosphoenolpyruvate carboxykinase (ATP) [Chloroherpetonaceae bacterium]|nr:phosphoenolpyruvate carboxykinase (ATP) [Chthonomonadaceae bacterium]MDW8208497.1 phosphoenolpyruvate carboxykinase (ATP) [Chloroherpetonaceae bacterium]
MLDQADRTAPTALHWSGLREVAHLHSNLCAAALVEQALHRREGALAENGALVVQTGKFTGRSPQDKYIVEEPGTREHIWWGAVNQPIAPQSFDRLHRRIADYLQDKEVYLQELYAGADPRYCLPVRVLTEYAWHSLFARQLLIRPDMLAAPEEPGACPGDRNGFTLLVAPGCYAIPEEDGTRSETFIAIHFGRRMALIGGTRYAGEIKKSVFTVLNYLLPQQGVFPMHCSANIGRAQGDTALFFGLSGTGKTTLSTDPERDLIGDDEHGWSETGVFNFEGGCYAKCIRLSAQAEPQIWNAIRFGTVLENVVMDPVTRQLDFNDASLTENTRAAYPIHAISRARVPGIGGHPRHVVFLTADAFGVLPPISRLTPAQARFHFLSGYTARVAGTERGLGSEPQATFSACFGQPFLPLPPVRYAQMLSEKLDAHHATVWLVNTGWTGGPFGVGRRMDLTHTRAMLDAAIRGQLEGVTFHREPVFGLWIPETVPGVPSEVLNPRNTWSDPEAYDRQARMLARRFVANFEQYRGEISQDILAALPSDL